MFPLLEATWRQWSLPHRQRWESEHVPLRTKLAKRQFLLLQRGLRWDLPVALALVTAYALHMAAKTLQSVQSLSPVEGLGFIDMERRLYFLKDASVRSLCLGCK